MKTSTITMVHTVFPVVASLSSPESAVEKVLEILADCQDTWEDENQS